MVAVTGGLATHAETRAAPRDGAEHAGVDVLADVAALIGARLALPRAAARLELDIISVRIGIAHGSAR